MKKIILGVVAVAMLAIPTAAIASVAVDNGVGTVGKGDVQSALGWNNAAFDKGVGTLKFTAGAEKVIADYKMSCFNGTTGAIDAEVSHQIISQPGTTTVTATPVFNAGNGKQIIGFDLTGQTSGFTATGGATLRMVPCPEGSFSYMNLGQGDLFGKTQITGGLKVSGMVDGQMKTVDLPNTPVPAPVV
jgi:hypothetical protein